MSAAVDLKPGTFSPLRVSAYRRAWVGILISNVGTFLQLVAAPWMMNEMTGSPFLVAMVASALWMPRLLLTIPAGAMADMFDRRTLLILCQLFNAVAVSVLAYLAWQGALTPGSLLGLSLVLGMGTAISLPAQQTFLPDQVPVSMLPNAVTLNAGAFNAARAIGPAIGGALVAAGLTPMAFAINAATYIIVAGALLTVGRDLEQKVASQPMIRSAVTGVLFARFTEPIRATLAVAAVFALTAAAVESLLPSVVSDDLELGARSFGLLYGGFGFGAIVGVLTREQGRRLIRGDLVLPLSISAAGLSGVVFGLSPWVPLSAFALFVAGASKVWTMTTLNATVQMLSPRWIRTRVTSLFVVAAGLQPFGALIAGTMAEQWKPGLAVAIMAGGTALLGIGVRRFRLPVLDQIDAPTHPDDWPVVSHPDDVGGSPVTVVITWTIEIDELEDFLEAMRDLRRHRIRTGARRWALSREVGSPQRFRESFQVFDWSEHLGQHQRIDDDAANALRRARSFDRALGPQTQHLIGVDLRGPLRPIAAESIEEHAQYHGVDGSIPLSTHE